MPRFCQAGDVLLYFGARSALSKLTVDGEKLEDPGEDKYAYHMAIAIGPYYKIEANGKETTVAPIDYGNFSVYRPPYDAKRLPKALQWLKKQDGKLYGVIGVFDQGLRDISGGHFHLPRWLITWIDDRWPYCSWEGCDFVNRACSRKRFRIPMYPPPSPEDAYIALQKFKVEV